MLGFEFPKGISNLDLIQSLVEVADHRDLNGFVEGLCPDQISLLRGLVRDISEALKDDFFLEPEEAWFDREGIKEMFSGVEAIIKVVQLADPEFQVPKEVPWLREWLSD